MITGESLNVSEFAIQTGQIVGSPVYCLYKRRPGLLFIELYLICFARDVAVNKKVFLPVLNKYCVERFLAPSWRT